MNSKMRFLVSLIVELALVACIMSVVISIQSFKVDVAAVDDNTTEEDVERDIVEQHLYTLSEINESLIGKKIAVVGFMCDNVADEVSAAWLCDDPFRDKDYVEGELRIDTGSVITYTPMPIEVIGRLVEDTNVDGDALGVKLSEATIYIFDGNIRKYKRISDILNSGVIEHLVLTIDDIEQGNFDDESRDRISNDAEVCCGMGEEGLELVINRILEYDGNTDDAEAVAENAKKMMLDAIYETGEFEYDESEE